MAKVLISKMIEKSSYIITWGIDCTTKESFLDSLELLAKQRGFNLKYGDQSKEEVLYPYLREELSKISSKDERWLILMDNVDDYSIVREFNEQIGGYRNGNILYTTRDNRRWGNLKYHTEKLNPLERGEAKKLFYEVYSKELVGLDKLLEEYIESYPLDIVLCASYMKNTGYKLEEYIDLYIRAKKLLPKSFIQSMGYG